MSKAAAVAAGAIAIMAAASPAFAQGKEFPDVPPDHWAAQAVKLLEDRGIVIGYPDGTYGGPKAMTRYEFAEAISRLLPQIDQRIAEAIAKIPIPPPPDLSNYVTKTELDDRLGNYYTKPEADARFALKSDIDRIMGILNEFRDELTRLGMDVNALKQRYAALEARVSELEKLRVFGSGTVAFKESRQGYGVGRGPASNATAGVDRDGALLDNGFDTVVPGTVPTAGNQTGKHGTFSNPSAFYDTQLGVQYSFTPKLRAVAQFIMGNYWGAWEEQQAFDAAFTGAGSAATGLRSNRTSGSIALQTYEAYLSAPFDLPVFPNAVTQSGISVGRIPTKMTRYTWWAVDPDTYINVPREDSGNILVTGGALTGKVDNFSVSLFGGYNPTDGTTPYVFDDRLDPSRDGTIGAGHYVRPGGSQTGGLNYINTTRTHLDTNYYHIPTLTSVAGIRLALPYVGFNYLIGTGDDWNNPAFQTITTAGTRVPMYNRFAQVWSIDGSTTIPVKRLSPVFPVVGFQGEWAQSKTNNYGAFGIQSTGAFTPAGGGPAGTVPSSDGNALDYKLTFPIGSTSWTLGARSISPGFQAPGYWGQLGSWVNPWNIVTDSPIYLRRGHGSGRVDVPLIPTEIGIGVPLNFVPVVGDLAFSVNAGVGHMHTNAAGFPTPVGPSAPLVQVTDPDRFRISHASMGFTFGAGKNSGYKFGLSSEDVLRDYPAGGGFKRDVTFLWDALRNLVNVQGGHGVKQPAPGAVGGIPELTSAASPLAPAVLLAPTGLQSDENYYQLSVGKNLTADGNALAKLLFQRVVYTDRTGNGGGSYRGDVGALQVTYKF